MLLDKSGSSSCEMVGNVYMEALKREPKCLVCDGEDTGLGEFELLISASSVLEPGAGEFSASCKCPIDSRSSSHDDSDGVEEEDDEEDAFGMSDVGLNWQTLGIVKRISGT